MRNARADLILGASVLVLAVASFGFADTVDLPPPIPPDMIAEHAGATVLSLTGTEQSISGSTLNAINGLWNIETSPWGSDVPQSRAVWAMFNIVFIYDETGEFPIGFQVIDHS